MSVVSGGRRSQFYFARPRDILREPPLHLKTILPKNGKGNKRKPRCIGLAITICTVKKQFYAPNIPQRYAAVTSLG